MRAALLLLALPASAQGKPHADWDRLLQKHVSAGRVDYDGFARDRAALDGYLRWAADAARKPDLAFYLNAYNATVVVSVLRHGRPVRILDVKGFFDGEKHRIAGEELTLNDLETKVRKRFSDPRIHFALNCAARSCPPLLGRAFEPATLEATLDDLTRGFLDGPGVKADVAKGTVAVSKLFEWYKADFVAKEGSVEKYLLRWVSDPVRRAALAGGARVVFLDYDWSLNGR